MIPHPGPVLPVARALVVVALTALTAAQAGCAPPSSSDVTPIPAAAAIDAAAIGLQAEIVTAGLEAPVLATSAGDGSGRLFVVEQAGRIRVISGGRLASAPFLDISARISAGSERGLLGLAFHPGFPADPRLFVDYTDLHGNTVISSFSVPSDSAAAAERADADSEIVLLRIEQPFANHNGGALVFGPDGYLYAGTGDGGSGGDPQGNGQRLDTLLGKLLRVDVDGSSGGRRYAIPPDNPFASGGGAPEIWAYGLRNPWRFSFDRATGDLWIGDVGQDRYEEIDRTAARTPAPVNYGWNRMEGSHCFSPASGCERGGLALPIAEYSHELGCAVTGGHVARGKDAGALAGVFVFGDYCSGRIWGVDANGPDRQEPVLLLESGRSVSSFGEDESGGLLLTDISRGDLVRLVPAG